MSDILPNSLCCLQTAFAHVLQETAEDIADVQGPSHTIGEEAKATVAVPGFG